MLHWVVFALLIPLCATGKKEYQTIRAPSKFARGWGPTIRWAENYTDGLGKMVKSQKPLMVIHHLDICPYSQVLKKTFVSDKTIQKMARESFIMLNVLGDTDDPNLATDGYYVPRILFIDPSKTVRNDIKGRYDNRWYAYAPEDMELLVENMKRAKSTKHNEL